MIPRYSLSGLVEATKVSAWKDTHQEIGKARRPLYANLLHSVQHVRLAVVIPVGADPEVNLAWVFVGFKCLRNT